MRMPKTPKETFIVSLGLCFWIESIQICGDEAMARMDAFFREGRQQSEVVEFKDRQIGFGFCIWIP